LGSVRKNYGETQYQAIKGKQYFHKLSTDLKSDSFFPSDVKIAEPPGRIHISLTALVSGGRWILRTSWLDMLIYWK
jgi:hypothetical protein